MILRYHVENTEIEKKSDDPINKLDPKKSTTGVSISLLEEHIDICALKLTEIFNLCISKGIFPDELKVADISPTFKFVDSTAKKITDQLVY